MQYKADRILPDVGRRIRSSATDTRMEHLALLKNRILRAATIGQPDECWLWPKAEPGCGGYARIRFEGSRIGVHRASYMVFVDDVPEEMVIDHLCRTRLCFNPAHLEPVTNGENVLRGIGITAQNARATTCCHGHALTAENTYTWPSRPNLRQCRICHRAKIKRISAQRRTPLRDGVQL